MKKRSALLLWIIFIFTGLVLLRLITAKPVSRKQATGKVTLDKIVVKVSPVEKGDLNLTLSYVGSIKARDEINVFSKVPGKLVEYAVNEGEAVEKGQTIALIDRDETGLKYELAKVESPLSGTVGRTFLDKGATVLSSSGIGQGTPMAIIVNMDEMMVKLSASEQDVPYLKTGLKAEVKVDAYPDDIFTGEISKVSEVVDTQTRTLPIEIKIPNLGHRLKSGMFCRIKIIASQHNDVLVLLQDAVIQEQDASYVFVVEDHTARKRKITPGIQEDSRIEILDGLKEGEKVIVFGQQGLKDGTSVEIAQE